VTCFMNWSVGISLPSVVKVIKRTSRVCLIVRLLNDPVLVEDVRWDFEGRGRCLFE
jgi:hypothetical protein